LGGTPFHRASSGWLFEHLRCEIELIREFDRPAYMLCVGVNDSDVAQNPETNALVSSMRLLWTRDNASAAALAEAKGSTRIQAMADLAHLCFDIRRPVRTVDAENEPLILVIHSENPSHLSPSVLNDVVLGHKGPVYWYCQEVREFGCTEMATYHRLSDAARAKLTLVHPDYHGGSIEDLISVFYEGGTCLTSRYHSALIASWMGLRVIVFARNAKLNGVIEQLGLTRVRSLTAIADIREALAKAKPVDTDTLQRLRETASEACTAFFRMAHV
jgi:polysaccharide pyruvyl transferase WcaK-like protein